jgi:predicted PurR-regulated permease PerM
MADVRKSFGQPVLYGLILLGIYLTYLVLKPFLVALTWAAIFAVLFRGAHLELARRVGPSLSALVTTLAVAIVIVGPAVMLISALAREAPQVAAYLKQTSLTAPRQIQQVWDVVRARSPVPIPEDPTDLMTEGAQRAITFLAPHAGALVADFFALLGNLVAMLFAFFFMLRDGDAMSRYVRERLPFSDQEGERLMAETQDLVIASVGSGLIVAVAQGAIGGIAFWLIGIGAPVFWGVVMGFASLLPVVGAALVWVPVVIGLLVSGAIGPGLMLLTVGVLGISMADNVLRPLLLSGRTSMNGLVVFFGLLGGVAVFGFIGLIIGPIILVTTARLLEHLRRPPLLDESGLPRDPIV